MDLTHLIERLEAFEERMGVRLEALFMSRNSGESHLKLMGELHPMEGSQIQQSIELVADVYDGLGRVVDRGSKHFFAANFFGFETFEFWLGENIPNSTISKIRLYPKKC